MRAVITPAERRAAPVWVGCGIAGGTIFGPTGLGPHELTSLAVSAPGVGAGLVATWVLLFLPVARVIVRADNARYLKSLPAPRWPVWAIGGGTLIWLQLPWLAVWIIGKGAIGAAVVAAVTGLIVGLASLQLRPPRVGALRWRGPRTALFGVYARGLYRRAGDAMLRAAGLAILAGLTGGLFVRNNVLEPLEAAVLATGVIAVVLVPGWAGTLGPLLDVHRTSAWLAGSVGISETSRRGVLAAAVGAVYVGNAAIASGAACLLVPDVAVVLVPVALATSVGLALCVTRALIRGESSPTTAARNAIGAIAASALAVVALGLFGAPGVAAIVAIGVIALGTA